MTRPPYAIPVLRRVRAAAALGVLLGVAACSATPRGGFPLDYRHWYLAAAGAAYAEDDPLRGFHAAFVSPTGYEASLRGGPYPEGTVWLLLISEIVDDGRSIHGGERFRYALMRKLGPGDAPDTDDWIYELYRASDQEPIPLDDPVARCHDCHRRAASTDFVFSMYRF